MKEELTEFKLRERWVHTLIRQTPLWLGLVAMAIYYAYYINPTETDEAWLFFILIGFVISLINGITSRTVVHSEGEFLHLFLRSLLKGEHSYTVAYQDIEEVFCRDSGLHIIFKNKREVILDTLSEYDRTSLERYLSSMIGKTSRGSEVNKVTDPFIITMPWWDRLIKVFAVTLPYFGFPFLMFQMGVFKEDLFIILALASPFFIGMSVIRLTHLFNNPYIFTSDGYFISGYAYGASTTLPLRKVDSFEKGSMSHSHALYVDGVPELVTSFLRSKDMALLDALFNSDRESAVNQPTTPETFTIKNQFSYLAIMPLLFGGILIVILSALNVPLFPGLVLVIFIVLIAIRFKLTDKNNYVVKRRGEALFIKTKNGVRRVLIDEVAYFNDGENPEKSTGFVLKDGTVLHVDMFRFSNKGRKQIKCISLTMPNQQ